MNGISSTDLVSMVHTVPTRRMNSDTLDDTIDNAIRAGVVWIQSAPQTQVISEQLRTHDFIRGTQGVVCVEGDGGNNFVKQAFSFLRVRYPSEVSDSLCSQFLDQVRLI